MRHLRTRWNSPDVFASRANRSAFNIAIRVGCLLLVGLTASVSSSYTIDWSFEASFVGGGASLTGNATSLSGFAPFGGVASGSLDIAFVNGIPNTIWYAFSGSGHVYSVFIRTYDSTTFISDSNGAPRKGVLNNRGNLEVIGDVGSVSQADYALFNLDLAYGGAPPWVPRPTTPRSELGDWIREQAAKHQRENPSPPFSADPGGTRGLIDGEYSVPVVAEHGYSDYIWANAATPTAYPNSTSWNAAYLFATDDPFTHFIVPDALPGGDNEFKVIIDDSGPITLQAGTAIELFHPQ